MLNACRAFLDLGPLHATISDSPVSNEPKLLISHTVLVYSLTYGIFFENRLDFVFS